MKKLLLAATCFVGLSFSQAVLADTLIDDPLHGWCAAGCTDNGTNTPIPSLNQTFGFFASPANTGTLILKFLIPNNDAQPGSIWRAERPCERKSPGRTTSYDAATVADAAITQPASD